MRNLVDIYLDIKVNNYNSITIQQNDDVTLKASVYDNGVPLDLTTHTVILNYTSSKNAFITVSGSDIVKHGNVATIKCPDDFSKDVGYGNAQLTIIDSYEQASSFPISVRVNKSYAKDEAASNIATVLNDINVANSEAVNNINKINNAVSTAKDNIRNIQQEFPEPSELCSNVNKLKENPIYLKKFINSKQTKTSSLIHIMAGIDSLTNGADGHKYDNYFSPRIRGEFGNGGIGYVGFNTIINNKAHEFGTVLLSGNFKLVGFEGFGAHSLDGKGVYIENSAASDYYTFDCSLGYFEKGKLFYLKHPNGGSFDVGWTTGIDIKKQTVNTYSSNTELGVIDLGYARGKSIKIFNMSRTIVLYGAFLYCDKGVIFSKIGKGGDELGNHNKLNKLSQSKWLEELKPDIFILNAGTNDRGKLTQSQFKNSIQEYMQPYIDKDTSIVLCRPNAVELGEDVAVQYEEVEKELSLSNNLTYVDFKDIFGEYKQANESGLMLDGTHPNDLGVRVIANKLLSVLDVPLTGKCYPVSYSGELSTNYSLDPKRIVVNANTKTLIHSLGFKPSWSNGLITIDIKGYKTGTISVKEKELKAVFQCQTIDNTCSNVAGKSVKELFSFSVDGSSFDYEISVELENGLCNIYVKPSVGMTFVSDCSVYYSTSKNGKLLFDNI